MRPVPAALAGAAVAAAFAWLSQSTLSLAAPDGPRLALLPVGAGAGGLVVAAALGVFLAIRAGAPSAPLALLALVALPFMPTPVPDVFLIWAGHLRALVWCAVAVLLLRGPAKEAWTRRVRGADIATVVRERPRLIAGVLSCLVFGLAAFAAAPSVPGGDEPHYLVITQSLLLDGDLKIENNHERGDYQAFVAGTLPPHFIQRGRNGEIYSIHAPGVSVLVLPAFALGGYPAVVVFLVLAAALGGVLLWHVNWLATGSLTAAWFGWAAVTLSSTTIFHTFTVYPDGPGGLLVLSGIWALLRADEERRRGTESAWPWLLHGAALSLLPWLHTRFALLAGSLGALLLWRISSTRNPAAKAVAFLALPAVSALCWVGYFIAIYGTPDPSAPYGSTREFSSAFVPGGLAGLLFDQRFGLFANAPVLLTAGAGFWVMLRSRAGSGTPVGRQGSRRLAYELLFVAGPYLVTATHYAMWWGGWSAPARFAAVVVPALGVPCAASWAGGRSVGFRFLAGAALAITAFVSAALVIPQRGRLAFNTREGYSLLLDWLSPVADLGRGLPVWFRDREPAFFAQIAVWMVVVAAAAMAATAILGGPSRRGSGGKVGNARPRVDESVTVVLLIMACALMIGVGATWRLNDVPGRAPAPSQLNLLRELARGGPMMALRLNPPLRLALPDVPASMRIEPGARYLSVGAGARRDRPLLTLPAVPAGRYRVSPSVRGPGGWLMIGIAQDQFALVTEPLATPAQAFEVDFPVDVRALVVSGDDDARRTVTRLTVEPLAVRSTAARLTDEFARRAVRYGSTTAFFMDERSFPEPEAFWIGGARRASVVLDPDSGIRVRLELRNAPVANRVRVSAGEWRFEADLAPGEERALEVPLDARAGAALVSFESSAGFRPSEMERESRDHRFLGFWVKIVP